MNTDNVPVAYVSTDGDERSACIDLRRVVAMDWNTTSYCQWCDIRWLIPGLPPYILSFRTHGNTEDERYLYAQAEYERREDEWLTALGLLTPQAKPLPID